MIRLHQHVQIAMSYVPLVLHLVMGIALNACLWLHLAQARVHVVMVHLKMEVFVQPAIHVVMDVQIQVTYTAQPATLPQKK